MQWIHHPGYTYGRHLPLPARVHGFLRDRAARIHAQLRRLGTARDPIRPTPVSQDQVRAVHTEAVVRGLSRSRDIARAIELPLLALAPTALLRHAVVQPQLLAAGGTLLGLRMSLRGGWAINLSGGFHHARPDRSHGFCLINDVAVAVAAVQAEGGLAAPRRLAVIDLDLHQGDGNAAAFAKVAEVTTASLHQASAFPRPKLTSDVDLELPDGAEDEQYLTAVDALLARVAAGSPPAAIVYVAGTDPFVDDTHGTLRVSAEGLLERDRRVARFARAAGAGLLVLPAGGYAEASPNLAAAGFAEIARVEP